MDSDLLVRVLLMRRVLRDHERWTSDSDCGASSQTALHAERTYNHSPFYRRFSAGFEEKPLHELPIFTTSELMNSFDDLVTDRNIRLAEVCAHLDYLQRDESFLNKYRVTRTAVPGLSPDPTKMRSLDLSQGLREVIRYRYRWDE